MAYVNGICTPFQSALVEVAKEGTGVLTRTPLGFLDAITSELNTRTYKQIQIQTINGGQRTVELIYTSPQTTSAITSSPSDACTPGTERVPKSNLVQVTRYKQSKLTLNESEVARICYQSSADFRAELMMGEINAINEAINADLQVLALNLFGNNLNTGAPPYAYTPPVAPLTARLINGTTGGIFKQGFIADVSKPMRDIRVNNRPIIVGAGDEFGVFQYASLAEVGCCNNEGINTGASVSDMYYFYDEMADTNWGQNGFVAFAPGAFQLVRYNSFAPTIETMDGQRVANPLYKPWNGNYEKTTIMDPITGLEYDVHVEYNSCGEGIYVITTSLKYDLFALPADNYDVNDRMYGVRRNLYFEAVPS